MRKLNLILLALLMLFATPVLAEPAHTCGLLKFTWKYMPNMVRKRVIAEGKVDRSKVDRYIKRIIFHCKEHDLKTASMYAAADIGVAQ